MLRSSWDDREDLISQFLHLEEEIYLITVCEILPFIWSKLGLGDM